MWPELAIVAEARNGREAVELFDTHQPQVVFLDVHMPGLNGIEAGRSIARRAQIVFVTAYEQYAVQAFEQGAIDYLVKPVDATRLSDTVQRLKERLARAAEPLPGTEAVLEHLAEEMRRRVAARLAAVDQGVGRHQRAPDPGRAGRLPSFRREVHPRRVGRRRGADPQDDPRARRRGWTPNASRRSTAR